MYSALWFGSVCQYVFEKGFPTMVGVGKEDDTIPSKRTKSFCVFFSTLSNAPIVDWKKLLTLEERSCSHAMLLTSRSIIINHQSSNTYATTMPIVKRKR